MLFDNILFPVDFSDSSIALKSEVESIAKKFNSHVTLFHVTEISPALYCIGDTCALSGEWINEMVAEAQHTLDSFALDLPVDKVTRVSVYGDAATQICEFVRNHRVDLVTMAAHGHGAVEGLILGSVTVNVLHTVNVPIWLFPQNAAPGNWTGKFKIVYGADLQTDPLAALIYAQRVAEAFDATVTLVHSVPESDVRPDKYFDAELFTVSVNIAKQEIAKLQAAAHTNFPVKVTGLPLSHALAEAAAEEKANLILIGRGHSQKFLGRFRTQTYNLLNQITCPVLSVPQTPAGIPTERLRMAAFA